VVVLDEADFDKVPDAAPVERPGANISRQGSALSGPGEVHHFDPRRDASADIRAALMVAVRERKHVLLEIGGDWCPYCILLDSFFDSNPEISALRRRNFVYVKVNFSQQNQNQEALAAFPPVRSFPHFFVLDAAGKLVKNQRIALLGTPSGYSPKRFQQFLRASAPKAQ